jgi:hypothetical protein
MAFAHEFEHLPGGQHSRHMPKKLGNPQYVFARGYISKDDSRGTLMVNGETGTTTPG